MDSDGFFVFVFVFCLLYLFFSWGGRGIFRVESYHVCADLYTYIHMYSLVESWILSWEVCMEFSGETRKKGREKEERGKREKES